MGSVVGKWPESIISTDQGRDLDQYVSRLVENKWFESPMNNRFMAEAAIQDLFTSIEEGEVSVRWLEKQEIAGFIQDYNLVHDPMWPHLYDIPQQIYDAAQAKGIKEDVSFIMNDVPEHLFHAIYDGAFKAFEEQGKIVISHVVAAVLYITCLHISCSAVCDRPSPIAKLFELLSLGYLPLGVKDGSFHVY